MQPVLLLCVLAGASVALDGSAELRKWFDEYRRGAIDLHQPVSAPIVAPAAWGDGRDEIRYCATAALDDLRARVDGAVADGSLDAARVLMDLATYQPVSDPREERRRFVGRQPWLVRRLGREALRRLRRDEVQSWLATIALDDTNPVDGERTRAAAANALGATTDERFLSKLAAALEDPSTAVRCEAAAALGELHTPLGLTALERAQQDADANVRLEALLAIDRATADRSDLRERRRSALARGLADSSWPARLAAARLLASPPDKEAIPLLIDALEAEAPGGVGRPDARRRVRSRIRGSLMELTGKDFPSDRAADWTAWWNEVKATFEIDPAVVHVPVPEQGPRFFGIPLDTDVVLFLIDASGSMDQPASGRDGPTRIFLAQFELKRCLNALEPGTRFNIATFNEEVVAFRPAPVAKSEATLKAALEFVAGMKATGGTDLYLALDWGLGLSSEADEVRAEHLDTLVLLSDGVASRGAVLLPEEILASTLRANRRNQVAIHCVNAATGDSALLDQLAAATGGARAALSP